MIGIFISICHGLRFGMVDNQGILDRIRVVDVSHGCAGAIAAGLLADFGADVIALRRPTRAWTPEDVMWDRGKRLIFADPQEASVRRDLKRLVEGCDVLIYDLPVSPSDPTCEMTTGGEDSGRIDLFLPAYLAGSTPWSGCAESSELLHALGGLARFQTSYSGGPVDAVYPYLTTAHGIWAATTAVAALIERERSGRGQRVTVGGAHATALFAGYLLTRDAAEPDPDRGVGPAGLNPMYTRYRGADGRWFFVGALGPKFAASVLKQTDSVHLLDDPRVGRLDRLWGLDNYRWVIDYFAELYATQPAQHWVTELESCDVPCTLLEDRETWFASEQVAALGMRVSITDPRVGLLTLPGVPIVASETEPIARPPIIADAICVDWLAESAAPAQADDADTAGGGPLRGIRIASFGSFVAGPLAASLLAELGADVIKVEPPEGDPWRVQGFANNRGVRSLAVDVRDPAGHSAVLDVLAGVNLCLDNFRNGVMARLGLDRTTLTSRNPDLVTVAVTAYGESGPLRHLPGYDTVLQAAAGIMNAQGGNDEPVIYSLPPNDHAAAILGALASVLGLFGQLRTGRSQHMSTSLAAASVYVQAADLVAYHGRPQARSGGADYPGPSPTDRIYATSDGYVRIQTSNVDGERWRTAGLSVSDTGLAANASAEIESALGQLTVDEALRRLAVAEVPAVAARSLSVAAKDNVLHQAGVLSWREQDALRYTVVNRMAEFTRTPRNRDIRAPGLGQHSCAVLLEAGIDAPGVEALMAAGVVVEGGPLEVTFLPAYR